MTFGRVKREHASIRDDNRRVPSFEDAVKKFSRPFDLIRKPLRQTLRCEPALVRQFCKIAECQLTHVLLWQVTALFLLFVVGENRFLFFGSLRVGSLWPMPTRGRADVPPSRAAQLEQPGAGAT